MNEMSIFDAVFYNKTKDVESLVKKGADPNEKCGDVPVLTTAIKKGHFTMAKKLLELGANPNATDKMGITSFHYAVSSRHNLFPEEVLETVNLMLEKGADVNIEDKDGHDALHWSLRGCWRETIKMVIRAEADLHKVYRTEGENILFETIYYGTPNFLNWLIQKKGVNKNIVNKNGDNLIDCAAKMRRTWMLETLVDNGLNINAQDEDGNTAIHKCFLKRQCPWEILDDFLKNGFDFNIKNKKGQTILDLAVEQAEINSMFNRWVSVLKEMTLDSLKVELNKAAKTNGYTIRVWNNKDAYECHQFSNVSKVIQNKPKRLILGENKKEYEYDEIYEESKNRMKVNFEKKQAVLKTHDYVFKIFW